MKCFYHTRQEPNTWLPGEIVAYVPTGQIVKAIVHTENLKLIPVELNFIETGDEHPAKRTERLEAEKAKTAEAEAAKLADAEKAKAAKAVPAKGVA